MHPDGQIHIYFVAGHIRCLAYLTAHPTLSAIIIPTCPYILQLAPTVVYMHLVTIIMQLALYKNHIIKNCRQHYGCFALIGAHQCSVLAYARVHTCTRTHQITETNSLAHSARECTDYLGRDTLACTDGTHTQGSIATLKWTNPWAHTESTSCRKTGTQMKNGWFA